MRVALWTIAVSSVRVALISFATAVVFFALFVAAAIVAPQDQQAIRRTLVDAISSGEINRQMTLGPLASSPVYRSVNDCLNFVMITAPQSGGALTAIGNRMAWDESPADSRVPPYPDCQTLLRILPEFGGGNLPFFTYDRYLLGMRVVGRVMLSVMSIETMQRALLGATYALLSTIGIAAFFGLQRARDAIERERHWVISALQRSSRCSTAYTFSI